jgi:phosphatidylglycerophosphate synthase
MLKRQKRKDNDPSMIIMRQISYLVAKILSKTKITPNQITVFNFIIFVPLILFFFIKGTYIDNLIGLGLIIITVILDLCDGVVARIKSLSSTYGGWLDSSLDSIFQSLLLVAIVIGLFQNTGEVKWFIVGLLMIFGQNMANVMGALFDKNFGFEAYSGSSEFTNKFINKPKLSLLDAYLKNIIVPSNFIYTFIFTCRYFLVMGILLNRLDLFLIFFSITINIRWISMWFLYLVYLAGKKSNLYTVNFLRELYDKKHLQ